MSDAKFNDARKQRLNEGLRSISEWCAVRASGEFDPDTTLTMLEKKAAGLRGKVLSAGWRAILALHPGLHGPNE